MPVPPEILKDESIFPITLFPNQGRGALWGVTDKGRESLPEGVDFTLNMTIGADGRILTPSLAPTRSFGLASINPPVAVVPWQDTSETPTARILYWNKSKLFKNASITDETVEFNGLVAPNPAFFQSESATPAARLYAGTSSGDKELNDLTQAGVWNETASTPALLVVATGKDFYKALNDFQVERYVGTGAVTDNSNYGGNYNVGSPESKFRSANAILDKSIWAKTDGKIYAYDRDSDTFIPIYETAPHPLHFPTMFQWNGGLITSLYDGAIVWIPRSGAARTFHLLEGRTPSRDTPRGRIVSIAAFHNDLLITMDSGWKFCQPPGMRMFITFDSGGVYTEYSTEIADGRDDTYADLSSLDTAVNGDWILLGSDTPWTMADLRILNPNATAARLRVKFIISSSLTGFTSFEAIYDGTNSTPDSAATPFGQSGRIGYNVGTLIYQSWRPVALTINGESIEKYWLMLYLE